MKFYETYRDAYKKMLNEENQTPEERKSYERKIEIYDFLSKCEEEDVYTLFDSAAFNTIFLGYIKMIMNELSENDDEDIKKAAELLSSKVNGKARAILDRVSAKEAEDYL